jgi:hypothetical protein
VRSPSRITVTFDVAALEVGRLYPIGYKWAALERLWTSGSVFGGPVDNAAIAREMRSIVADLQLVILELEGNKGDFLD